MISAQPNILIRLQYGQTITHTSLSVPMGVFAVHIIKPDNTEEINYIHKDHTSTSLSTGLGSWNTITDESGNLIQELSFDACSVKPVFCESSEAKTLVEPISAEARGREGNRRDPATWRAFAGTPPEPLFDRGFTGHEHLYAFNLINMNGRVYDPIVSRMLSPDNFIQAPGFSQSLNRYSYALNNPLRFTDPSGYSLIGQMAALTASILFSGGNPIVAAGIYAAFMTMDHIIESGRSLSAGQFLGYFTQTFTLSVVSAGGSQAIGNMLEGVGKLGRELLRASAHGVFNGTMRLAQGGKPAWLMPVRQV